jgi:hypothetical protein
MSTTAPSATIRDLKRAMTEQHADFLDPQRVWVAAVTYDPESPHAGPIAFEHAVRVAIARCVLEDYEGR